MSSDCDDESVENGMSADAAATAPQAVFTEAAAAAVAAFEEEVESTNSHTVATIAASIDIASSGGGGGDDAVTANEENDNDITFCSIDNNINNDNNTNKQDARNQNNTLEGIIIERVSSTGTETKEEEKPSPTAVVISQPEHVDDNDEKLTRTLSQPPTTTTIIDTHQVMMMNNDNNTNDDDDDEEEDADHQCQLWSNNNNNNNNNTLDDHDDDNNDNHNQQQYYYGDIWSNADAFGLFATHYEDFNSSNKNSLRALLDSNDFSLVDLLAHEELLQELRGCNEPRLMEYFSRPEVVAGLVECLMLGWNGDDDSNVDGGDGVGTGGEGSECGLGRRNEVDEKKRKERWCAMETKRREEEEKLRKEQQSKKKKKNTGDSTSDDGTAAATTASSSTSLDVPKAATTVNNSNNNSALYDISSTRQSQEKLHMEVKWNSPPVANDCTTTATTTENNDFMDTHNMAQTLSTASTTQVAAGGGGGSWPLHHQHVDTDDEDEVEKSRAVVRTPEEEYDMQFIRYPYMACEVLCSDAIVDFGNNINYTNSILNVLVNGYVNEVVGDHDIIEDENEDVIINDEEDSLLGDGNNLYLLGGEATKTEGGERVDDNGYNHHVLDTYHAEKNDEIIEKSDCESSNIDVRGDVTDANVSSLQSLLRTDILHQRVHRYQSEQQSKPRQIRILDLLFGALIDTPPCSLDDRRAGYFERILNVLFQKRGQAMSDYLDTKLIVTDESVEMARKILGSLDTGALNAIIAPIPLLGDCAEHDVMVERSSSYISLVRKRSEDINEDEDINSSSNNDEKSQRIGTINNEIECKFPLSDAPPILMCALFDHLHSYPIMHVVQRLLIPSPLRRQHVVCQTKDIYSNGKISNGASKDTMNPKPMVTLNAREKNAATPSSSQGEDDEDDECELEDQIEDPINQIFQCDWMNRKTDQALELLFKRLGGDTSSFLLRYGYPVGYDVTRYKNDDTLQSNRMESISDSGTFLEAQEAALLCSQHATEILTTIIQNSALDAPVMKSLSSDPSLQRIVDLIVLPSLSTSTTFAAHESVMTCAITVLESLVLQLGGYGAVVASTCTVENGNGKNKLTDDCSKLQSNLGPSSERAHTSTLIRHVTTLLTRLSELLNDPITDTWVGPSQYSGGEHRILLGASRLRIVRLIESFVLLGDPGVDLALQNNDCLEKCIELFWKFEWCSMLHQSIANLLVHVLEGGECRSGLQEYFLGRVRLMERLMDSFEFEDIASLSPSHRSHDVTEITERSMSTEKTHSKIEPRYGEMMLAMKTMFVANGTSSMESEHGSQSDDSPIEDDEGGTIAPVSEDDVDSAMEKECEEENGDLCVNNLFTLLPQGIFPSQKVLFRKGNMGHVIIICQALVNVCNVAIEADEHGYNETGATTVQDPSGLISDDETFTSVPNLPTSTVEVVSNVKTQSPSSSELDCDQLEKASSISELLRKHPLFETWQKFVTCVLVPEISVQSTPLGGQRAPTSPSQMITPVTHGDAESTFFDVDEDGAPHFATNGSVGEFVVGEIDMDENDFDTAAAMIEALRGGNKRRRDSGDDTAVSIANFGSTIYQPGGFKDYVYDYDDPLGHFNPSESGDCNGEEDELGHSASHNDSEDEGLMSDAMVISKEGVVANHANNYNSCSINRTGYSSSDEDDDDGDNNVPVLDLFTGSFEPDFAIFNAIEGAVVNCANPFDENDQNSARESFFDAINGCINHTTTDTFFEFSETPFVDRS